MRHSIIALTASLLVILCALITHWLHEKPESLGMEAPKGVPPSQKPPMLERLVQPVSTPEEAAQSAIAAETVRAAPKEWEIVDVRARVTHGGQPLPGAWMTAGQIEIEPETGHRNTMFLFQFSKFEFDQRSDGEGYVSRKVRYPAGLSGDSLFGVAVFHGALGTAYDEVTVDELQAGAVLDLEPEMGQVLTGKVVGVNGEPIPNAQVYVNTESPHEAVWLYGIGARSGPDGSFRIPGLRFDNKLVSLWASAHSREHPSEDMVLIEEYGLTERRINPESDFNQEENAWQLGDIALALTKQAVDLTTGEVAPLPSDE